MTNALDGSMGLDTTFNQRWPETSFGPLQLPSTFAPTQTSDGNIITSKGAAGASVTLAPLTLAPQATNGVPNNPAQAVPQQVAAAADGYIIRGAAIVLGFIFVAVGLNMFRPGTIPNPIARG